MNFKNIIKLITILVFIMAITGRVVAHEIYFCGERIPLTPQVTEKLMDIIKKQIKYNVVSRLKEKESQYIRTIELYLDKFGMPDDLKYLAIVESGLRNVQSPVGAAGFWQIMPGTARDLNLLINGEVDERNDLNLATRAACQHLANNFKEIRKKYKVSSWILTAAAYNVGVGSMGKAIKTQGNNYFNMDLNKETAEYVYKIIAVKELFEYPELYMKDFGYNVFNNKATSRINNEKETGRIDNPGFDAISLKLKTNEGNQPQNSNKGKNEINSLKNANIKKKEYVFAHITGNYDDFKDSSEIKIVLEAPLRIENSLKYTGNSITGIGWKIADKIFVDFGYGKKLIIIDFKNKKHDGISESALRNNTLICLQVTEFFN